MRGRKAQAAMEFLMTYGWAILVVLVVIGALAYFGVLSPGRLLPDRCQLAPGLTCDDYDLEEGGVLTLKITNNLGQQISITGFSGVGPDGSAQCPSGAAAPIIVAPGAGSFIKTGTCTNLVSRGSKQRLQLSINYQLPTALPHTLQGEIYTVVR